MAGTTSTPDDRLFAETTTKIVRAFLSRYDRRTGDTEDGIQVASLRNKQHARVTYVQYVCVHCTEMLCDSDPLHTQKTGKYFGRAFAPTIASFTVTSWTRRALESGESSMRTSCPHVPKYVKSSSYRKRRSDEVNAGEGIDSNVHPPNHHCFLAVQTDDTSCAASLPPFPLTLSSLVALCNIRAACVKEGLAALCNTLCVWHGPQRNMKSRLQQIQVVPCGKCRYGCCA